MLAMVLGYLAVTASSSVSCYSYAKGLANIGISRLAWRDSILNPPFHNTLARLPSLGDGSFSAITLLTLRGLSYEGQSSTNCTVPGASVDKAPLSCGSSPRRRWLSMIIIYIGQYTTSPHNHNLLQNFRIFLPFRESPSNLFQFQQFLQFLALHFFAWLTITKDITLKSPRFVQFYNFSAVQSSTFNFLRYPGPRRLQASRRVLVDGDDYQIMRVGRGAFATITRVLHKPSADFRVMKRIVFDKAGLAKEIAQAEVDSLRAMAGNFWFPVLLNHFTDDEEFIITMVCFIDEYRHSTSCFFLQPFYARGDMGGLIQHKGYLGSGLAQFYCAQLVSCGMSLMTRELTVLPFLQILAIQCLHKQDIIHRDIKPENIFIDESGHLILADLGLAEDIGTFRAADTEMDKFPIWQEAKKRGGEEYPLLWVDGFNPLGTRGIAGTYWYTAPEVFRNERYSFGVDYYSVGVIYYELVTGRVGDNSLR